MLEFETSKYILMSRKQKTWTITSSSKTTLLQLLTQLVGVYTNSVQFLCLIHFVLAYIIKRQAIICDGCSISMSALMIFSHF